MIFDQTGQRKSHIQPKKIQNSKMISYLLLQEQQENKTQVSFNQNSRISYTWRRFVRFPIAPDKLPERDWLGAPLWKQNPEVEGTWKFLNAEKRKPKKEIKKTHNPITRFSGEQVIIAQLQGSTESSSQLLRTPCGSFNAVFTLIKASTGEKEQPQ